MKHELGDATAADTCRKFNITRRQFYYWKEKEERFWKFINSNPLNKVLKYLNRTLWFRAKRPYRREIKSKLEIAPYKYIRGSKSKQINEYYPNWYGQLELCRAPKYVARRTPKT
ncbi:MAG: hypothetical protein QMD71_00110 [bacterium]|nr:hypothetical protein [bacterium]